MAKFKVGDTVQDQAGNVARILEIHTDTNLYWVEILKLGPDEGFLKVGEVIEQHINVFDRICELVPQYETESQTPHIEIERPLILTMQDAYRFEHESNKPRYTGQALEWAKDGRCPKCGELGRYHLSTAICSKHGTY